MTQDSSPSGHCWADQIRVGDHTEIDEEHALREVLHETSRDPRARGAGLAAPTDPGEGHQRPPEEELADLVPLGTSANEARPLDRKVVAHQLQ